MESDVSVYVQGGFGVIIRKDESELYEKLVGYIKNLSADISTTVDFVAGNKYPALSIHKAGTHIDEMDDEDHAFVVTIDSTVTEFKFFPDRNYEMEPGAWEFSPADIEPEHRRQILKFCEDFGINKDINVVVWNYVTK